MRNKFLQHILISLRYSFLETKSVLSLHVWAIEIPKIDTCSLKLNSRPDYPFPKQALVFTCLLYKSVEKTVRKRRNCSYQAISLFPAVFSIHLENFLPFLSNLKLWSANLSLWKSLKFVVWERVMRLTLCLTTSDTLTQYCYGRPLLQAWLLPDLNTIHNKCIRGKFS